METMRSLILISVAIMLLLPGFATAQPPAAPGAAPSVPGKRYRLTFDDALEALAKGEGRPAVEFYRRTATELEARGAKVEAAQVTTLWKVDDRASFLLMESFYDHLKTSEPAQALREAQRSATKTFPHPFAWAAFGFTGLPR